MSGDASSVNSTGGGQDLSISTYCANRIKNETMSQIGRLLKLKRNRMQAVEKERNILSPAQFLVKHEQSMLKYPIKNEQQSPAGKSMSIEDMKIMPHFIDRTQSQAGILKEIRTLQKCKEEAENKSIVLEKYFEAQQREYRSLFRRNSMELEMMHTQQVALIREIGEQRSIGLDYERRFSTMKQEYFDSKKFYENYIKDLKGTIFQMEDKLNRSKQKEKFLRGEIISLRGNSTCPSSIASPRGSPNMGHSQVEEGIRKTLSMIPLDLIPRPIPENKESRVTWERISPYATLPRTNSPAANMTPPPKPPRLNFPPSPKAQIPNVNVGSPDRANMTISQQKQMQQRPLPPISEVSEPRSAEISIGMNNTLTDEDEEQVKPVIWAEIANKTPERGNIQSQSRSNNTERNFSSLNDKDETASIPDSNSTSWASMDSDDQDQRSEDENRTIQDNDNTTVINMQ